LVVAIDVMINNIPEGYGVTIAEELNAALVENSEMELIDVRRVEELEDNGVVESGDVKQTHIPLEDFIAMKDM
jgi:rhodanese-related sulfurtransferase